MFNALFGCIQNYGCLARIGLLGFSLGILNSGIAHNSPLFLLSGIRAALSTYLTVNWRLGDYSLTTIPKHFYGFPKQTNKKVLSSAIHPEVCSSFISYSKALFSHRILHKNCWCVFRNFKLELMRCKRSE